MKNTRFRDIEGLPQSQTAKPKEKPRPSDF